jgi:hypothetical protein
VPTGCTAAYAEDATFKVFTQVEEYDAPYVIAYDLYIAGTRVTSENAADILGDNAVSYDASTNTLTISGDITATGSSGIYAEFLDDIKIVVATPATIKGDLFFFGVGNVTITGSPTLTIIGSINAQSSWESFIISNANIDITGSITSQNSNIPLMIQSSTIILHQSGGYRSDNITSWADLILTDCYIKTPEEGRYNTIDHIIVDSNNNPWEGDIHIKPGDAPQPIKKYDLYVAGTQVTEENSSDILGDHAVSYTASTNTLTISGDITATESSGIYAEDMDDIKIVVATPATIKGCIIFYGVGNVTITGFPLLTIIGSIFAQSSWESFIISNANIDITGSITSQDPNIPLMIQSSTITLHQSGGYYFDNITSWTDLILTDCYIETPEEGRYNTKYHLIVDSNNNPWEGEIKIVSTSPSITDLADVNNDGIVNIADVVAVAYAIRNDSENLTYDINNDGYVNAKDIVDLVNIIANINK